MPRSFSRGFPHEWECSHLRMVMLRPRELYRSGYGFPISLPEGDVDFTMLRVVLSRRDRVGRPEVLVGAGGSHEVITGDVKFRALEMFRKDCV
jgi:hypothetical protein